MVEAVLQCGYEVRVLARRKPPEGMFSRPVEAVWADLLDHGELARSVEGMDAVIHLAAVLHLLNPPPSLSSEYERVNVGGTAALVAAAANAGVKRIVYFSTIAVYGPVGPRMITEDTSPAPDTPYARTKLAGESIALAARRADGHPLCSVLRVAAVYGPRIQGNYKRLVEALAQGRFLPVGRGSNRRTLIYQSDVGRAAILAACHEQAAGRLFNVSDGTVHTVNEIVVAICQALGRRPPRLSIPVAPVRATAYAVEKAFHLLGKRPPVTAATIDKYTEEIAVDSTRIQTELGFQPAVGLQEGWCATIEGMRKAGDL